MLENHPIDQPISSYRADRSGAHTGTPASSITSDPSGSQSGCDQSKPVVNQALDSVMDMAVQLPALKKRGKALGMSMDKGLSGVTESLDPRKE